MKSVKEESQADRGKRLGYIDALKGFAILCVVLGHIVDGYRKAGLYADMSLLGHLSNGLYAFHMPLFMILSGFVYRKAYFCKTEEGWRVDRGRLKLQVLNLVSVYFIWASILIVTKMIFSSYVNNTASWKDIMALPVRPYEQFWYLYTLAALCLLFYICRACEWPVKLLLPLLLVVNLAQNKLVHTGLFQLRSVCNYALFFYVGIIICGHMEEIKRCKYYKMIAVASGIFAMVLCILYWSEERRIKDIWLVGRVVALGLSLFLIFIFEELPALGNCRLLQLYGRYSLEVFAVHVPLAASFRVVISRMGIENAYLAIVLNLMLNSSLPILFAVVCKKLKLYVPLFRPASFVKEFCKKVPSE